MDYGFQIGDRVRCISPPDDNDDFVGHEGTVLRIAASENRLPIFVQFDHSPRLEYEEWWCEPTSLEIIDDTIPVFETDFNSVFNFG